MAHSSKITIVGAGIGGTALALLLAEQGHQVSLLEKRDERGADTSEGRSINLALSRRGVRTLSRLGLLPRLRPHLVPMAGRAVHRKDGTDFHRYDLFGQKTIYSVQRARLVEALLDAARAHAGIELTFSARCLHADLDLGRLRVALPSTREVETKFDALIGADGVHSTIRDAVIARRGGTCVRDVHRHGYKELVVGKQLAARLGMGPGALHLWPRGDALVLALPNADGAFAATLFLPLSGEAGEPLAGPELLRFLAARFPELEAMFPSSEEWLTPPQKLGGLRCSTWHDGDRALVIGDAAHAITPFLGQGANAALEDGFLLAALVQEAGPALPQAFSSFFQMRKPAADAISELSTANYLEMCEGVTTQAHSSLRALEGTVQARCPEYFAPLYAMVSFSTLAYDDARRRAETQRALLERAATTAASGVARASVIDAAVDLLRRELPPLPPHVVDELCSSHDPDMPAPLDRRDAASLYA